MSTGKAPTNFIPEIWSTKILMELENDLVFGALCNRNYEGEIKDFGDTVRINSLGPITISDYVSNTDMPAPQVLSDDQRILKIDQQKSFNFVIDDVVKAQSNVDLQSAAIRKAAYGLANSIDEWIAGFYVDTPAQNNIGTDSSPIALTNPEDFYPLLTKMRMIHNKRNTPYDERYVVIPPEAERYLLNDTKRFVFPNAPDMATNILKNGRIDTVTGYRIYVSNNIRMTNSSGESPKFKIMAYQRETISLAVQISSVETYRMEKRFSDAVKGLCVFGAKTIRPETLVTLTATFAD